jgi:hypothetical protein
MAKQSINVGATANDKKGDSLRAAFQKVNANFTELYTALGLAADADLNLGNFVFESNTVRLTNTNNDDSTATQIEIAQPVRIESDLTVGGDVVPNTANGGDLGSAAKPWRSLYVSNSTVFLGGVPLSLEPGTNELRVNNVPISQRITYADIPNAPRDVSDLTDDDGLLGGGGGEVDLTVTVPGETYKGFGARYGRVYANSSSDELTVSKIVIFKEAAETSSTIHPTSSQDDFEVTGLGDSDVVAMFVLYGDTNSEKSLTTLKAFARTAIDTVILNNGVANSINTIAAMRAAFYDNIGTLTAAAGGLVANFEFFEYNTEFTVSADLTGQGTGNGFNVTSLSYNIETDAITVGSYSSGTGYTENNQIVIPGTSISYDDTALLSPANDITITITGVNGFGQPQAFTISGTLPRPPGIWRNNSISDGGNDQYDTANYINTNLDEEISYNAGVIVENAASQFGAGSKYVVVYDSSIFGIFATGSSATTISTSGGSGADGNSTTDTGELFAPDRTYDPALSNLTLTNNPLRAAPVNFVKADYATANDVDVIEDDSTLQIGITRGNNNGIYNPFTEEEWDQDVSPQGTLWSVGNTDDLSDVESRAYTNFYAAYGSGGLGNKIPGSTAVMYVPSIEKYYLIEWNSWTQGQNNGGPGGGGFSYTRTEIDVAQVEQGLRFSDGTVQTTAYVETNVKSTAPGQRRIEEVTGYKEVSVTARILRNLTTTASRNYDGNSVIWFDRTTTTIDEILNDTTAAGIIDNTTIEFSLDNTTWYKRGNGELSSGDEKGFVVTLGGATLTYSQGDTVYFRYVGGGAAQVWWDKSDLPGGSNDFRGAIIDYHAFTGQGTIVGTIHIIDDDGDEYITHTEVSSADNEDSMHDNLWIVSDEGTIRYARFDGDARTLRIHWTAKVFYGSDYSDD